MTDLKLLYGHIVGHTDISDCRVAFTNENDKQFDIIFAPMLPYTKKQLVPYILALVDAVSHEDGVVCVRLKLVPGASVVGPGYHEGVEGDGPNVLLHLEHPDRLGLDAVHGEDRS